MYARQRDGRCVNRSNYFPEVVGALQPVLGLVLIVLDLTDRL